MDIQPGGSAAPVEPAAPVVEPTAPVAPQAPVDNDDSEWNQALEDVLGVKQETKNEPTKPEEKPQGSEAPEGDSDGEKPDAKPGESDDADEDGGEEQSDGDVEEEDGAPNTAVRDTRVAQREAAAQLEQTKSDIREKMFADVPTQLTDADGDPIKSVEDVMKLINPRTGEAFTEEEAGMWLISAQQQFNQNLASVEKQIEQIAETTIDVKDQADSINYKYGELLKEHTDIRDELWAEFSKTFEIDKSTGIILKAPVNMEKFYDTALKPYVQLAQQLERDEQARQQQEAEQKRQQSRSDRSDIYGPTQKGRTDPDDDEWAAAAKSYYGK